MLNSRFTEQTCFEKIQIDGSMTGTDRDLGIGDFAQTRGSRHRILRNNTLVLLHAEAPADVGTDERQGENQQQ